jgi:hypothetical protein
VLAFGFSNDNAKILSYKQAELPVFDVLNGDKKDFEWLIKALIDSANLAAYLLQDALKAVVNLKQVQQNNGKWEWVSNKSKEMSKTKMKLPIEMTIADERFWNETSSSFYSVVQNIAESFSRPTQKSDIAEAKKVWAEVLKKQTKNIFYAIDEQSPCKRHERSICQAEKELDNKLFFDIRKELDIPIDQ